MTQHRPNDFKKRVSLQRPKDALMRSPPTRATKDDLLTKLEFSWGMRRETLNVDTRLNIVRLRRDAHALFDTGRFILLPEDDVVEKYMKGEKPDFNGDVRDSIVFAQPHGLMHSNQRTNNVCYKYTLIASPKTDGYPLHRLPFPALPGESQEAVNFLYPFSSFPVLQSHVHPCFAICHAGRFKPNVEQYVLSTSKDLYFRLSKVLFTYARWMSTRPSVEFLNNPRLPTDRDDRTGDDETHSNRADDTSNRRSARLQNKNNRQGSPLEGRGGKKRQRSNNQRDCHDDTRHEDPRGLRALKAENTHPHTYKRKREFVRDWVSSVVGQTFVEDDTLVSQKSQTFDEKGFIAVEELRRTPPDISEN